MAFLRVLACIGLLALVLPSAAIAQETLVAAAPDPAALRVIEDQVATLRGLRPQHDVSLQLLDEAGLHDYLRQAFDRDYLPSERESDQKLLVTLGLLKPNEDLVQIQFDLLQAQVIGVYDPDDKKMFVVGSSTFGPAERITFAHEFNHALQDQYYDLNALAPKHPVSNDRSLAAHAVVEGDAVLLQTLWATANLTPEELIELARSGGDDDALARVPLVVRTELLFPYTDGFSFVRKAYRDGGNSYAAIDAALRNPPVSTAEILHPDKYAAGWRPVDVELPDVAGTLGAEWRTVGAGVLGELDTRVLLEQYGERTEADRIAAAWSGDRWLLLEKDGRSALVLRSTWESEAAASSFFSAYKRGLRARFSAARTEEDTDVRQALSTPIAATDLQLQSRDVLTVLAFDRQTAQTLVDALTASGL
jgi:hypothetical protein